MIASLKRHKRRLSGMAAIGVTALVLAACNTSYSNQADGGIEFREDRHAEITAMRSKFTDPHTPRGLRKE